jgi:hypothetical protein
LTGTEELSEGGRREDANGGGKLLEATMKKAKMPKECEARMRADGKNGGEPPPLPPK